MLMNAWFHVECCRAIRLGLTSNHLQVWIPFDSTCSARHEFPTFDFVVLSPGSTRTHIHTTHTHTHTLACMITPAHTHIHHKPDSSRPTSKFGAAAPAAAFGFT